MSEPGHEGEIKRRILDAGVLLFSKRGYDGTSIREIAAAGVTKPMLYPYFGSKEGLCRAALRTFTDEVTGRLDSVFARCADPFELLVDLVWEAFECFG